MHRSMPPGMDMPTQTPPARGSRIRLPELYRESIPAAGRIDRQPGLLDLDGIRLMAPLIRENLVERSGIIIDAKSGVSSGSSA